LANCFEFLAIFCLVNASVNGTRSVVIGVCLAMIIRLFVFSFFDQNNILNCKIYIILFSRVAESEVKCPAPTPTFPKFLTLDSDLSKISDSLT